MEMVEAFRKICLEILLRWEADTDIAGEKGGVGDVTVMEFVLSSCETGGFIEKPETIWKKA